MAEGNSSVYPELFQRLTAVQPLTWILAMHMKKFSAALLSGFLFSASAACWAAPPKTPVQIEADQMLSSQKDNSVYFSGQVHAKQEDLTIHSDEMTVYYTADAAAGKQKNGDQGKDIQRLLAKGHVEITKQGWIATGDQAEYFSEDRKVVLTGNTKVWQNNNLVTGDTFIMYLDEGKTIVERSAKKGERVKAFFYPDGAKKP